METSLKIKRLDFLRTTGATGVVGLLGGLGDGECLAEGPPGPDTDASSPRNVQSVLTSVARDFVTVAQEEGRFLNLLVKLTRARRVLELGTAYGYTTIWLALALEETGGLLTTIEIRPERAELAKQHLTQAGLSHRVRFEQGDAHAIVPTLEGPFDIAYLDADKGGNPDYFNRLFPSKLPPGSLLIAHNAILLADQMKAYLDRVGNHPELETLIARVIEVDGFALTYRRRIGR